MRTGTRVFPSWPGLGPRPDTLKQTDHGALEETTSNGAGHTFFERLHGLRVLLVGLGPGTHMREAQPFQSTVDRVVGDRDAELLVQPHDQVAGPPAHHTMDRR